MTDKMIVTGGGRIGPMGLQIYTENEFDKSYNDNTELHDEVEKKEAIKEFIKKHKDDKIHV